jgi:hypothetical protein
MEQPNTPNTFIASDKAKYLWATLLIIAWTGLAVLFRYPERGDVLQKCLLLTTPVYLLWCAIGLLSINYLATWPHRILFAVGLLILGWLALYQINWRPDGLIRTPPPWQQWRVPTEPQQKAAYDFAHSLKTPNDFKDDGFYKEGLFGIFGRTTYLEYIEHLCDTQAGEFIYKTVEGVEGLYEMRPRTLARETEELGDLYRMEDPYGYGYMHKSKQPSAFVSHPHANYNYFETTASPLVDNYLRASRYDLVEDLGLPYWHYSGYSSSPLPKTKYTIFNTAAHQSRYGFTWRGMRVPHDRANGIAGGELFVIDLKTNEVLAMRRGFARASGIRNNQSGISWEWAYICPMPLNKKGEPKGKSIDFEYSFITKVLPPLNDAEYRKVLKK